MWIEPVDAKKLIPERTELALFAKHRPSAERLMMRTTWQDADVVFTDAQSWLKYIDAASARGPVLLDNGVYSYLLMSKKGKQCVLMDPHRPNAPMRHESEQWLAESSLWMALSIAG